MPVTASRKVCPHAWTQGNDRTETRHIAGVARTITFLVFTCSLCGQVEERELQS
jgi:hypothetical protein